MNLETGLKHSIHSKKNKRTKDPARPDHLKAWFVRSDGSYKTVSPARLPGHDTAWAISVHKSQGSEFDQVLLLLPEQDNGLITRELIYTGLTRAISRCVLSAPPSLLRTWVKRRIERPSGLAARLELHASTQPPQVAYGSVR